MPLPPVTNLAATAQSLPGQWQPQLVTTVNGSHSVKVARVQGEFLWHAHPESDEVFQVVHGGPLRLELAGEASNDEKDEGAIESVELHVGDLFTVPRGRRHRPVAENETGILMIEKVGTVNTGDERDSAEGRARTVLVDESGA